MTDSWARRRARLAKEKKWVDEYVSHLPELKPCELVRGRPYHAVTFHEEGCRIYSHRAHCSCRPTVRFYAEPTRS
jgi:hypothetical protein